MKKVAWNGRLGAGMGSLWSKHKSLAGSRAQASSQSWFCPCHLTFLTSLPKAPKEGSDLSPMKEACTFREDYDASSSQAPSWIPYPKVFVEGSRVGSFSISMSMSRPEALPGRASQPFQLWEVAWGQFMVTKGALFNCQGLPIQLPGVVKLPIKAKILNIFGLVVQETN